MRRHGTFLAAMLLAAVAGEAAADALDRIAERGEIRFGVRESSAPFSYRTETGEAAGLAVRLCRRVANALSTRLGKPIAPAFVTVDAKTRFAALAEGRVDVHCGPMTQTLARRETLDFSIPYFMDGIGAALRRDGPQDVTELKGQPVGALAGTTGIAKAAEWGAAGGSKIVEFASHEAGLRALAKGEIDAYFGDQGLLVHQLNELKKEDRLIPIRVMEEQFSYEPYSLAMKAGEGRLRLEVDRALSRAFLSQEVFDDIQAEFGDLALSDFAAFLYVLVALPE